MDVLSPSPSPSPDSTDNQEAPRRRITKSQRAELVFPVGRVHRKLKLKLPRRSRIGEKAPVFLAAVLQSVCEELFRHAVHVTREEKRVRITPDILLRAMEESKDFKHLKRDAWVLHAIPYPSYRKEEKEHRDILAIQKAILSAGKRDLDERKRRFQETPDSALSAKEKKRKVTFSRDCDDDQMKKKGKRDHV